VRPVNLIPPEERRGSAAAGRTGALSLLVVGILALAVVGVTASVLLGNDVNEKKAEVAALEQREAEVQARAASLASFANFKQIKQARSETISALAASRFDWRRVMEELARVIPARVWLVKLSGSATGEVEGAGEAAIAGPSLEMTGCARSQRDVARMIGAVEDIDGVTRVTVTRSEKSDGEATGSGATDSTGVSEECRTRAYIAQFDLVAAFDAIAVPEGATPPLAEPGQQETPASSADDGSVGDAQQAREDEVADVDAADGKARNAAGIVPGGGG
jgi:Tfp pilus assembly protein PilN